MEKVLFLGNSEIVIYNFRFELIERLLKENYEIIISCPIIENREKIDELIKMGCKYEPIVINRHGVNIIEEIRLYRFYKQLLKKINPDIIFSYTVKPNIYGAMASKKNGIPFIANISGLGVALENPGFLQKIIIELYKKAFSKVQTVFFQNKSNQQFFINNKIAIRKHKLLPGSGVNLSTFQPLEYPIENEKIKFVFISRIMKDKGIEEYLGAAKYIKEKYPHTEFHICGFLDGDYEEILMEYESNGVITYHGMVDDVREILKQTHCTVHPSYHEGLSNVLLESAASGRPVIASDVPGCRETFDEGISGFGFKPRSTESLIGVIENFLKLSNEEKRQMGLAGRKKMEREFDREIVVDKYLKEIEIATEGR